MTWIAAKTVQVSGPVFLAIACGGATVFLLFALVFWAAARSEEWGGNHAKAAAIRVMMWVVVGFVACAFLFGFVVMLIE